MKKLLLTAAACALTFGAFTVPTFAKQGTKDVTVTYNPNFIPDPDNPDDADWAVEIPKSFTFTDDGKTNNNMGITLHDLKNGGLPVDKKVEVSVTSANSYDVVNDKALKIAYELTYDAKMAKDATKQQIGFLDQAKKTIAGTAELTGATTTADGIYKDVLTYTVESAVAK